MVKVKFTSDFGVKRTGDVCQYDNSLASQLVNIDKVAEYTLEDLTVTEEIREYIEPALVKSSEEETMEENSTNEISSEEETKEEVVKKTSKK